MARVSYEPPPSPTKTNPSAEMESHSTQTTIRSGLTSVARASAMGDPVEIVELDKAGVVQRKWLHMPDNTIVPVLMPLTGSEFWRRFRGWREPLMDSFLPVGFPYSVSADYLAYQTFDSLQAFFSTITSLLANRALLEGLGVGDSNTSATFALLLTILKDLASRLTTIAFAHKFGLAIEPECKRYRFLADLFNDSAFFLDLVSPHLGSGAKIICLSIGEALRALCGVAAGASKAALSSHFALQDNLAELNAKEASQETAVGLFGLLVGTVVVKFVEDRNTVFWLMVLLVFVHLFMNYLGVRCVTLRTLNRQRATIVFQHWYTRGEILSPAEVSSREAILWWWPIVGNKRGESVARISFARNYVDAVTARGRIDVLEQPRFALYVRDKGLSGLFLRTYLLKIKILLRETATPVDAIKAWFMAMEVATTMDHAGSTRPTREYWWGRFSDAGMSPLGRSAVGVNKWDDPKLYEQLVEKGWDLGTAAFETGAPVRLQVLPHNPEKKEQ